MHWHGARCAPLVGLVVCVVLLPSLAAGLVRRVNGRPTSHVENLITSDISDKSLWPGEEQPFFGWEAGGTLTLDITISRQSSSAGSPVYILVMTEEQRSDMKAALTRSTGCDFAAAYRFVAFADSPVQASVNCTYTARYTVVSMDCSRTKPWVQGEFTFVNPSGDQLGLELIPLPGVYSAVLLLYLLLTALWVLALVRHRRSADPIQRTLLVVLVCRMVYFGALALYYSDLNDKGVVNPMQSVVRRFSEDLTDISGLFAFLAIATGYRITRTHLLLKEVKIFGALFGAYTVLSFSGIVCNSSSSCNFTQLFKYVVTSFLLIAIIVSVNCTILSLKAALREERWTRHLRHLYAKMALYREYRIVFIMYLLVPTIVVSLNFLVMTWRQEWAFRLTLSCLLLVLEAYLLFQFRPSRVNPVFIRMQLLAQAPPPPAQPEQPPPQEQEQVN